MSCAVFLHEVGHHAIGLSSIKPRCLEEKRAWDWSLEEMRKHIGVDSLAFISMDGLYRAVGEAKRNAVPQYCDACFTGDYPIPLTDHQERAAPNLLTLLKEPRD